MAATQCSDLSAYPLCCSTASGNLLANPEASVTIGGAEIPVVATQLTGAERDRAFQKFVDYTRTYEEYTGRTDRDLRVFALSRR